MADLDTVASVQGFFKQPYSNWLGSDIPTGSDLAMLIEEQGTEETCGGLNLDVKWAHKVGDGVGSGALVEAGPFPTARSSSAINYTLALTHRAYRVRWTGHAEAMGDDEKMSWIKGIAAEKGQEIRDAAALETSRWILHTGSAILGQITAIEANGANKYITIDGASIFFYQKNQRLTVRTLITLGAEKLTNANIGGTVYGVVMDVDYVNGRVVLDDTAGATVGDYVAWRDYYDATVMNGLQNIALNTGSIQGVTRTAVGYYSSQATVYPFSAAVGPMTADILRDTVKNIAEPRTKYKSYWAFHPTVRRWFTLATIGQNRFSDLSLKVGVNTMKVADRDGTKEFIEDQNLPTGKFWMVAPAKFVHGYPKGMKGGYAKKQGNSALLSDYNTDGQLLDTNSLAWIMRDNFGCRDFRAQGVGTGLTSP